MKPRLKPMTPGIPHAARIRAYLAAVVVCAGLTGVAWRAWGLQVGDGDRYRALAARQHALTVEIPAPRGDILDALGRPLAVTADADSIWANPREIRDVTDTADRLAALIGGSAAALEAKLGGDRRFVWLARHVAPELARRVREARLPGIEVGTEPRRWYPERAIGGTVIGRSDIDGRGVDGVELALNAQLIGQRGEGVGLRDVRGKRMFADGLERPQPGATVQLSLDTHDPGQRRGRDRRVGPRQPRPQRRGGGAGGGDRPRGRDGERAVVRSERPGQRRCGRRRATARRRRRPPRRGGGHRCAERGERCRAGQPGGPAEGTARAGAQPRGDRRLRGRLGDEDLQHRRGARRRHGHAPTPSSTSAAASSGCRPASSRSATSTTTRT